MKYSAAFLFSFSLILFSSQKSLAQAYGTAAGLRIGNGWGLTLQQQVALHTTVEVLLQSKVGGKSDVTMSLLGEQHRSLLTRGLNIYTGGGLYYTWLEKRENVIVQPKNAFGISPIAGIELTLGSFNVALDFKPNIKIVGGDDDAKTFDWQTGFSIRYVLASRFFRNDDWKFWQGWFKKKK